jgi:hypothetical protein
MSKVEKGTHHSITRNVIVDKWIDIVILIEFHVILNLGTPVTGFMVFGTIGGVVFLPLESVRSTTGSK